MEIRLQASSRAVCWEDTWRPQRSKPLDEVVQGDTAAECRAVEPQEQMPSSEDHAAGLSRVEAAVRWLHSAVQEYGPRTKEPMEPCTEVQMVAEWAESDEKPHSGVLLLGEGTEVPSSNVFGR